MWISLVQNFFLLPPNNNNLKCNFLILFISPAPFTLWEGAVSLPTHIIFSGCLKHDGYFEIFILVIQYYVYREMGWCSIQHSPSALFGQKAMVFRSPGKCNEYFWKKILSWSYLNLFCVVRFHIPSCLFFYFSKNLAPLHFFCYSEESLCFSAFVLIVIKM